MKISKTLKNIIFATAGICLTATLFVAPLSISSDFSYAETEDPVFSTHDPNLSVTAYDKNGNELSGDAGSVTVGTDLFDSIQQDWENLSYFKISYNKEALPEGQLTYSYEVTYSQVNVEEGSINLKTDHTYIKTIYTNDTENKNSIPDIYFYISGDINITGEQVFRADRVLDTDDLSYSDINGKNKINIYGCWGIYQFSFTYNEKSSANDPTTGSSKLYEVTPTDASSINSPLEFAYKTKSSKYSIDNAYLCKIICTSSDESDSWRYAFVDRSKLIWKVEGESTNGKKYVLLPSDIPNGDTTTQSILNAYDNTGFEFLLDFDIAGTWDVSCYVKESSKLSEEVTLKNVKVFSSNIVIIIVVVCVALAGGLLTYILIRSKKKEKIW